MGDEWPHVVILGAGFAGVGALQGLRRAPVRVTVVDRSEHHVFLPLLYQVATHQLGPEHVSSAVEGHLPDRDSFEFIQGEVEGVDLDARRVFIAGSQPLAYDYLLVALGANVNFFGTTGAKEHALPLYTLEDAARLRQRIASYLGADQGHLHRGEDAIARFCVVGGGATGVEVAGAIAELIRGDLRSPEGVQTVMPAEVHLFEMEPELLTSFQPELRSYARSALEDRGVQVHLNEAVSEVEQVRVRLRSGETLSSRAVIWAAGLQANPVAQSLGTAVDRRIETEPDLSIARHPEVFVAGDMAHIHGSDSEDALPQLGSVAQQSGRTAGENIGRLAAKRKTRPFEYKDKGTMAIIGRGDALVQLSSGRTLTGKPAFVAWKGVHLMLLKGGEQKASTLIEWAKSYAPRRSA
ncbi:MAG TPA: NAD(P)/FAD-dependent oxidoreductase [Dehalococcoidia bacterium]